MMNNIYLSPSTSRYIPFEIVAVGEKDDEISVSRDKEYLGYHLMCSKSGVGKMILDGSEHDFKVGTVFLLDKDKPHKYYAISKNWHTSWIIFKDEFDIVKKMLKPPYIYNLRGDLFFKYYHQIFFEAQNPTTDTSIKVSSLLYSLATELCQDVSDKGELHNRTLDFIHGNYMSNIGLEEMSETLGYSKQHICRVFKEEFHISPCDYLTVYRVNRAKQLIHDTSMPMADIAKAVGFCDSSYFGYVFKKNVGSSPAKFRELL